MTLTILVILVGMLLAFALAHFRNIVEVTYFCTSMFRVRDPIVQFFRECYLHEEYWGRD